MEYSILMHVWHNWSATQIQIGVGI
jgi:hypothetical protein